MTTELQVTTHFSFLRGASSAEELFATAAALGLSALGITDHNSLAGMVRAHEAAEATGVRLIVGCRIDLTDGAALLAYPTDRAAYGRLCRLLSLGKGRAGKGRCHLTWEDLSAWNEGLLAILLTRDPDARLAGELARLRRVFGDRAYCALTRRFRPDDHRHLDGVAALAARARVPTVVTGDVLYHEPARRMLQDVVTCIRFGTTIDEAGFAKEKHADRHLKAPREIARLFARHPDAVARTEEIATRCRFSLTDLTYSYPSELVEDGLSAQERLEKRTWEGIEWRYAVARDDDPEDLPEKIRTQVRHELSLIERMGYAPYFLTVDSIVRFARSRNILCQGRGSAANSVVCYALGITSIDPMRQNLLFERFVSEERGEPPDIDVDFEHERREEVIQWVYRTYGRQRAALTAVVSRYRARGAVREVGKVLGLPEDVTAALAGLVWGWSREGVSTREAEELNLNLEDRRLRLALDLSSQLIDTPRHLSQHPGGFVLTLDRLDELVPIEPAAMKDRQVIEWDKDDIDTLGFMKVDVLGLGMLGCMHRAFDLLRTHKEIDHDLATIPAKDEATYDMICRADTVGVFQIESRAQMAMLPRMQPRNFYDLVIEVAVVRPGPIQGDMVNPYLRRREDREPVDQLNPELDAVLEKTLGVPLFQEQAMKVAMVAGGFSASEADQLRRAMGTFKFTGGVNAFRDRLIDGMIGNGYTPEFAERIFKQLEGFGSYGFPESHAASFALIAYASSWMKCHHPDVFCCAILNSQPMGFYAPAQLVRDARAHGVEVLPIDINESDWDSTLVPGPKAGGGHALRLGLRLTRGLAALDAARLMAVRAERPFISAEDLWRRTGLPVAALVKLAMADAFHALDLSRREAVWAIRALRDESLPLFAAADRHDAGRATSLAEPAVTLPAMAAGREVVEDYRATSLSLRRHPVTFLRADLRRLGCVSCAELAGIESGRHVTVSGLVLVRQKPGSAKGVMFITLEDETDVANLIIWPSVFERQRRLILSAGMMGCSGEVQRQGGVTHVIAGHLIDHSHLLHQVGERGEADGDALGRKVRDIYIPDLHIDSGIKVRARNFR